MVVAHKGIPAGRGKWHFCRQGAGHGPPSRSGEQHVEKDHSGPQWIIQILNNGRMNCVGR
jgi:hypothetical protein